MPSFRLARFDLGRARFDPAAVLEAWLSSLRATQGFVLEKDDAGESTAFVGAAPSETLRVLGGRAYSETAGGRKALPGNPFAALGRRLSSLKVEGRHEPFSTGAVGSLSYEMTRHLERLPLTPQRQEAWIMVFPALLAVDRRRGRCQLTALIPRSKGQAAARRAAALAERLGRIIKESPKPHSSGPARRTVPALRPASGRAWFLDGVRALKTRIRAGDIFQGVLSERFTAEAPAPPLSVYRALRSLGSSPYLFYLRDGKRHLLGASPERLVSVVAGAALNCPIAGTRPRGATAARDRALERALKASPKERAEHLMLVDLARNDLGRVCAPGSVRVKELMAVRRYPNVMHLVSEVEGALERGKTAWDALAASFPAGTVSGAPKVRAMELLAGLERRPRGFYGGAIVQHDLRGNLDSCIAIRSAWMEGGRVEIQGGAGVVADSRPPAEYQEVLDKLSSLRRALALAAA